MIRRCCFSEAGKAYENCMKNGKQITEDLAFHMEELRKEEQHYEILKQEEEFKRRKNLLWIKVMRHS